MSAAVNHSLPILPIRSSDEVAQFAGKFVAYTTAMEYFSDGKDRTQIHFGYVEKHLYTWNFREKGYNLARLISRSGQSHECALVDSRLKKANLAMRLVTSEELTSLGRVILSGKAKIGYVRYALPQTNSRSQT